jgi:hypothetical protein
LSFILFTEPNLSSNRFQFHLLRMLGRTIFNGNAIMEASFGIPKQQQIIHCQQFPVDSAPQDTQVSTLPSLVGSLSTSYARYELFDGRRASCD